MKVIMRVTIVIQYHLGREVIQAMPYNGVQNSNTGRASESLWEQVTSEVTNAAVSVANIVYNGLVAVGNLIVHATEVAAKFYMTLLKTIAQNVQKAAEAVRRAVEMRLRTL